MSQLNKINLLVLENSIGYTGAFKSITHLADLLSDQIEFHFAIPSLSTNYDAIQSKYPVLRVPFIEINRSLKIILYLPFLLYNTVKINRYCRKEKINILHVNDIYNMVGILIKIINPKIKLIYHVRLLPDSFPSFIFSFWAKKILRYSDEIIVVSNAVKNHLSKWSDREVKVIYNTVPLTEHDYNATKDAETINLLYVANYTRGKGQDFALRSFLEANARNPNIRLKFMGYDFGLKKNKKFKEELIQLVKQSKADKLVEFLEPTTEVEKIMKESDIVLNFSEAESFSMTCYEALCYGKPVIATDCGGPAELIEHGISGWLVENKNIRSMTEAIERLTSDKTLREQLGAKAKSHISEFIKKNNISQQTKNIYLSLCESMSGPERSKILIIENSIGYTGAFKSIFYSTDLLSQAFEFHFVIPTKSTNQIFLNKKYPVLKIPLMEINRSPNTLLYPFYLLINSIRIIRYCRKHKIKIIHVNDIYNMAGVVIKIFQPRIKLIYHVRLLPNNFPKYIFNTWSVLVSNYADEIIAVSNVVKNYLKEYRKNKIHVIYDTIPLIEKYDIIQLTNKKHVTLLYIANYTRGKGHDLALTAFINAHKANPDIHLKFIGHDLNLQKNRIFKQELESAVKENNITEFVEFMKPTIEVEKTMKEADIILNFSEAESFSMTCYEALYYGRPLIATDCGGPSELFVHGASGWLVPNKDITSMTNAILLLSSDHTLREKLSKNAKTHIVEFAIKNDMPEKTKQLYLS